jgi:LacI family transcriptional regulator
MRRIAELGHTSVAFVTAPRGLMADADRLRQFRRQSALLGVRGSVIYTPLTLRDVERATSAVLSDGQRPTSIITNSDYTAHAIYKAARELSLAIGPAISVVGHDDLPTSELLDPPLATIHVDSRQMGQALMTRLLAGEPNDDFVAPIELVVRASLQAPQNGLVDSAYLR